MIFFVDLPLPIRIEFVCFSNRYQNWLGEKSIPPTPNVSQCMVSLYFAEKLKSQLYFTFNVMVYIVESTALSSQNIVARWRTQ